MPASKSRGRRKLGCTLIRLNLILDSSKLKSSEDLFTEALNTVLTTLYGVIGGAFSWDLVEFDSKASIGSIRCQKSDEERICAAASFLTQIKGFPCRLEVLESSPSLLPTFDLDPDLLDSSA